MDPKNVKLTVSEPTALPAEKLLDTNNVEKKPSLEEKSGNCKASMGEPHQDMISKIVEAVTVGISELPQNADQNEHEANINHVLQKTKRLIAVDKVLKDEHGRTQVKCPSDSDREVQDGMAEYMQDHLGRDQVKCPSDSDKEVQDGMGEYMQDHLGGDQSPSDSDREVQDGMAEYMQDHLGGDQADHEELKRKLELFRVGVLDNVSNQMNANAMGQMPLSERRNNARNTYPFITAADVGSMGMLELRNILEKMMQSLGANPDGSPWEDDTVM